MCVCLCVGMGLCLMLGWADVRIVRLIVCTVLMRSIAIFVRMGLVSLGLMSVIFLRVTSPARHAKAQ